MVPRPTSEPLRSGLRFFDGQGEPCEATEWVEMFLALPDSSTHWTTWTVHVNGEPRKTVQRVDGRAGCWWPKSDAGDYRIVFAHPDHGERRYELSIPAKKLGHGALERMLNDLEHQLPYALAAALQRGGALAGMEIRPPEFTSPAAEFERLRHILRGSDPASGLLQRLARIRRNPHRREVETTFDVPLERVRKTDPTLLRQAMYRQHQIDDHGRPLRARDRRMKTDHKTAENGLLKRVSKPVTRGSRIWSP